MARPQPSNGLLLFFRVDDFDMTLPRARTLVDKRWPLNRREAMNVHYLEIVTDIDAALATAVQAGGEIAHPPLEILGDRTFAIYLQGGNDHGLWQMQSISRRPVRIS